jgi:hypothetical protein
MKKKMIAIFVFIAIVIGAFYVYSTPNILGFTPDDIDYETNLFRKNIWVGWPSWKSYFGGFCDQGELFDKNRYPTSWMPGHRSDTFTLGGCGLTSPLAGSHVAWGKYWWEIAIYEEGMTDWNVVLPTSEQGGYDPDYIMDVDGSIGKQVFTGINGLQRTSDNWCNYDAEDWWYTTEHGGRMEPYANTVRFYISGPHVGYMRARLYLDRYIWGDSAWGINHCTYNDGDPSIILVEDYCELLSGDGTIYLHPNPEAPPGQGTDYYFEEGHTAKFTVNTGFDGSDGANWRIGLYNQYGQEVERDMKDELGITRKTPFMLESGVVNKDFVFTISEGDWVEGSDNRWYINLWNSIMEVDRKEYFTLYEGAFDDIPGTTSIEWLSGDPTETKYYPGDTIRLRMTADANAQSGRPIAQFECFAYYESPLPGNIEHHEFKNAMKGQGTLTYYAVFDFVATRDTGLLQIEGRAWDTMMLPGGTAYDVVYIQDENTQYMYNLYVVVEDNTNTPISGAKVYVSGIGEDYTDPSGKATFGFLPKGRYTITAEKGGYGEAQKIISLERDTTVILTLGFALDLIALGIAILIFAVMALIAYFVPMPSLYKKLIIILGVVLAVIIYLVMSGIIAWVG